MQKSSSVIDRFLLLSRQGTTISRDHETSGAFSGVGASNSTSGTWSFGTFLDSINADLLFRAKLQEVNSAHIDRTVVQADFSCPVFSNSGKSRLDKHIGQKCCNFFSAHNHSAKNPVAQKPTLFSRAVTIVL